MWTSGTNTTWKSSTTATRCCAFRASQSAPTGKCAWRRNVGSRHTRSSRTCTSGSTTAGTTRRRPGMGDPRFRAVLDELQAMHDRKSADYGRDEDPYANVRASEDWGIPGWVGALVREN